MKNTSAYHPRTRIGVAKGPKMLAGRTLIPLLSLALAVLFTTCFAPGFAQEIQRAQKESEQPSEADKLRSTAIMIDAIQQKMLGNITRAKNLFYEAAEKDPGNDAAFYELSKIYASENNLPDARKYIWKAIEIDPRNPEYQLVLADIYLLSDDLPAATAIYEQLAQDDPENIGYHRNLKNAYLYLGEFEKAIAVISHLQTLTGFSRELSIQKQRILLETGKYEEAIAEAEQMIRLFPDEILFYEILGELYMETGQADKAKEVYYQMLEEDPENYMARLMLSDVYLQENAYDKAFEHLQEALYAPEMSIERKARIIYSYFYWAEETPELLEQAIRLSEIMLEVHADEAETYLIQGDLLMQRNEREKARDMYLQSLQINPSNLEVWQMVVSLGLQIGDYEGMLKHSEMALEYFLEQPLLFLFNGLANLQLKNYQDAASSLEYGLMLIVDDEEMEADFLTMLGDVYYFLNEYDESFRKYEKALSLNPQNATALNNFSYHLALQGTRLDEALKMSQKSLEHDPDNAAFLDTFGWIHYKKGNYREAEVWIRKALDASEEPGATILEHYGDVLYKLGQKDDALRYWEKAEEAGNGSDFLNKKIRDRTLYE